MHCRANKTLITTIMALTLCFSGCADDEPTTPSTKGQGTILIEQTPDSFNGPWTLTGPNSYLTAGLGNMMLNYLDAGTYSLEWSDVSGWQKPNPHILSQTLSATDTLQFYGTYTRDPGSGTIVISPSPTSLNAPWTLSWLAAEDTSGTGDLTLVDMPLGDYALTWEPVLDWISPDSETRTLLNDETIYFTSVYESENPFANVTVGTDSTLEVMTWNLEHFAKAGDTTTELVIQAIDAFDVDIIGLQEIESQAQFEAVLAGLDGYDGWKASSSGYDINLAFIYRTDGDLAMTAIYEIMQDDSREFPRNPLVFEGTFDGIPITIINNHLKCCGDNVLREDDPWDEETRRRDACVLLEGYVDTNFSDRRVFLIGDFNDELDDSPERNVFMNFLNDSEEWRVADMAIAEGPSSGWSYPSWPSHLDHIIINQPLIEVASGGNTQVIPLYSFLPGGWAEYDQDVSDHLPVVLRMGL